MSFDHPLTFAPLCMERVWGGHRITGELERAPLTPALIGESWELVDRVDAQSVVAQGPHAGRTLHELWTKHRAEVFGAQAPVGPRFPLLAKILDARETLSVQVHPPASIAPELGGEPKTEMWYLLGATEEAAVYAGFKKGVDRGAFEKALVDGSVESMLHKIPVQPGDAIFIPSGRCHAIGAGCLIVEIQQNSDTTYRVFDWNRMGLDGKPRALHVRESLASIDFDDHEPALSSGERKDGAVMTIVAECAYFRVVEMAIEKPTVEDSREGVIFTLLNGSLGVGEFRFKRGDFFLLPASMKDRTLVPLSEGVRVLRTTLGPG
jgi:mannose-6-phosphate isomerase